MNIATGEVLTGLNKGHTGADILRFFKQIDATVPRGLAVHVVLDNLSAHSTPEIKNWLAHRDRRRWHLHFTPTSSSWLNLIERWFKELTDRRLRRGTFTNVTELSEAIRLACTFASGVRCLPPRHSSGLVKGTLLYSREGMYLRLCCWVQGREGVEELAIQRCQLDVWFHDGSRARPVGLGGDEARRDRSH